MEQQAIFVGSGEGGEARQVLQLSRANRHGLIAGATRTGKQAEANAIQQREELKLQRERERLEAQRRREEERNAARAAREAARPSLTDKKIQSVARAAASSVGRRIGNQRLRGLFGGLSRGR